jgi:hypothetical protein
MLQAAKTILPSEPPTLLDQVRTTLRTRHYIPRTEAVYITGFKNVYSLIRTAIRLIWRGKEIDEYNYKKHLSLGNQVLKWIQRNGEALTCVRYKYDKINKHGRIAS